MRAESKKIFLLGCGWGLLFGILNGASNIFLMPSAPFISLRPQIVLPMAVGILVHPVAGFITGFTGNFWGDALSGFGAFKFWNWHLANGLMGFIPGLIRYRGIVKISALWEIGILEMAIVMSCGIAVAAAVILDLFFLHHMQFPHALTSWVLPAFLTDAVNGFVFVPVILILMRRIVMSLEMRTILLVATLLLSAVMITSGAIAWLVLDDLASRDAMIENIYAAGIVSLVMLIVGFVASLSFVRKFTGPVSQLIQAAQKVEEGSYDLKALDCVSARNDELGNLSRVFQKMARTVEEREKRLLLQVEGLQIKIDRNLQAQDVKEIVDTDYFRELKKKAREFRQS